MSLQIWGRTQKIGLKPPTSSMSLLLSSAPLCQCCRYCEKAQRLLLIWFWKSAAKLCSGLQSVSLAESWCCALSHLLSLSLPSCQSSLANSFVKNFIEMHTDINVDTMKETLSSFCKWAFEGLANTRLTFLVISYLFTFTLSTLSDNGTAP